MSDNVHTLSNLGKTWIFDLDGTIVKHNGYLLDGHDTLLDGAKAFFDSLPEGDMIIIITARKEEFRDITLDFLASAGIRYDKIIFDAPYGERIVINDKKPSGLKMSMAVDTERDVFMRDQFIIDNSI